MKRKILVSVLVLLIGAVCAVALGWTSILKLVVQEGLSRAASSGANIGWGAISSSDGDVTVQSVEAWVPGPMVAGRARLPVQISFDEAKVSVPLSSVLFFSPKAHWRLAGYGGSAHGNVTSISQPVTGDLVVEGMNLALHPQIRSLGLASAVVTGRADNVTYAPFPATRANFSAQVSSIAIPTWPQQLSILRLPPVEDGSIAVEGTIQKGIVNLSSARLTSALFSADGTFRFNHPEGAGKDTCNGSFTITMHDQGALAFGNWLPIMSANSLTATTRKFEIRITGEECARARMAPGEARIGNICIAAKFRPL